MKLKNIYISKRIKRICLKKNGSSKIFEETILTNIKLNRYVDKNCHFFSFFFSFL